MPMQLPWMPGILAGLVAVFAAAVAPAQFEIPTPDQLQGFQATAAADQKSPARVQAVFTAPSKDRPGRLYITAEIEPGWHIYSITMGKGGPVPTKIKLPESKQYRLADVFTAVPAPTLHTYPVEFPGILVEEHEDKVTWHAPLELSAGVDPSRLKIDGKLYHQACNASSCLPPGDLAFTAILGQPPKLPAAPAEKQAAAAPAVPSPAVPASRGTASYQNPRSHSTIWGEMRPGIAAPGDTVQLTLRAEPSAGWHVYPWAARDSKQVFKPTLIVLTDANGWQSTQPRADKLPVEKPSEVAGGPNSIYHEGPVTWTVDIAIPRDASPGQYRIAGLIGYQTCWPVACDAPLAARFEAPLEIGTASRASKTLLTFTEAKYTDVAGLAEKLAALPVSTSVGPADSVPQPSTQTTSAGTAAGTESIASMLLLALVGGFVLNFMPCVLPVIGLKVLSFVEQSGQDRKRVLLLNVWYSLGLISVFLALATLAAVAGLGWGQQFARPEFTITMTCVVFVFALSFLGVWEIPIPGFVGGGTAHTLAEKEGPLGAFLKGVLTTILATPCTGPFMGTALIWAFKQPPHLTYAAFGCVGLGMASPYLLIGAFPRLVRFLPRPGAWMETFKHLMGFVLLATVVWLLSAINWVYVVPTVAMLISLWAACWWIGKTPFTADLGVKLRAWGWAAAFAGLMGVLSFNWLGGVMRHRFDEMLDAAIAQREEGSPDASTSRDGIPRALQSLLRDRDEKVKATAPNRLPWQAYTPARLQLLKDHGYTVLIDFTAHW